MNCNYPETISRVGRIIPYLQVREGEYFRPTDKRTGEVVGYYQRLKNSQHEYTRHIPGYANKVCWLHFSHFPTNLWRETKVMIIKEPS